MTTKVYYVTADITDNGVRQTIPRAWMIRAESVQQARVEARREAQHTFPFAEIHEITLDEFVPVTT